MLQKFFISFTCGTGLSGSLLDSVPNSVFPVQVAILFMLRLPWSDGTTPVMGYGRLLVLCLMCSWCSLPAVRSCQPYHWDGGGRTGGSRWVSVFTILFFPVGSAAVRTDHLCRNVIPGFLQFAK